MGTVIGRPGIRYPVELTFTKVSNRSAAVMPWLEAPGPSVRPPGSVLVLVFGIVVFGIVGLIVFVIVLRHDDPIAVAAADGLHLPQLEIGVRSGMVAGAGGDCHVDVSIRVAAAPDYS